MRRGHLRAVIKAAPGNPRLKGQELRQLLPAALSLEPRAKLISSNALSVGWWLVALLLVGVSGGFSVGAQEVSDEGMYALLRNRMVDEQIASPIHSRAIEDPYVLSAMRKVPRHKFVPRESRHMAYTDRPLPIEEGQTISHPFIVALMTELAQVRPGGRVLEVGTGSGYQAAVLASITDKVFSVEIIEELAKSADKRLKGLGYKVNVRSGDGYFGWPEEAPFDSIIVTAAAPRFPEKLADQLAVGGRLVIPVGERFQELYVYHKTESGLARENVIPVQFVPMTGKIQSVGSSE